MDRWRVTFTKKLDYEISAENEEQALVEAMKLNLDIFPLEWTMEGPFSLTQIKANSEEPIEEDVVELDSFGRPIIDIDGEEDEQDYL